MLLTDTMNLTISLNVVGIELNIATDHHDDYYNDMYCCHTLKHGLEINWQYLLF